MRSGVVCVMMAVLAVVASAADTTPQQVHIAFAGRDAQGNNNAMSAAWATADPTTTCTVRWGLSPDELTNSAQGGFTNYGFYQHCSAVMTDLTPETMYYYSVGDTDGGFSPVFSFVTEPSDSSAPFVMGLVGDMGIYNANATHQALLQVQDQIDWFLHIGDISYADDAFLHSPFHFEYENTWNEWMNWMQNITAQKPYMVLPGNHESNCHSPACLVDGYVKKLDNFTAYRNRFRMPYEESGSASNMWYSWNYGLVHFINIDTETDYPDSPEGQGSLTNNGPFNGDLLPQFVGVTQPYLLVLTTYGVLCRLEWLAQDLAAASANRANRPWIIVSGHRPIYDSNNAGSAGIPKGDCANLQKAVEDLLYKHQVDIYFAGHVHAYERHLPIYQGKATQNDYHNPTAPVYIIAGNAGCDEGHQSLSTDVPSWCVFTDDTHYGFGLLNVYNATTLEWRMYWDDNSLGDTMIITHDR